MKREPTDLKALVSEYEQKMSEASVPLWMDAPDLLDILDYYEQNNQYFEAETCIRLALRLHPDDPEVQIRRAYRFKNEAVGQKPMKLCAKCPISSTSMCNSIMPNVPQPYGVRCGGHHL